MGNAPLSKVHDSVLFSNIYCLYVEQLQIVSLATFLMSDAYLFVWYDLWSTLL